MTTLRRNPASCGGQILYGLYGVDVVWLKEHLKANYEYWGNRDHPEYADDGGDEEDYSHDIFKGETIVFSDRDVAASPGNKLHGLIVKHNLGDITSLPAKNPNTQRKIRTWVWVYNGNKIK